jgi:predicted dehydrogenase
MIRFGILGAGRIANQFAAAAKGIGEPIQAVASRDAEKAEAFRTKWSIPSAYDSYEALLADPLVDCVYVATPHGLHYAHMNKILDAGKHILCEKAFTLNASQAKAIFDKATEKGLFVMEAMWTRFLPTILEVQKLVASGEIGDIIQIDASFCFEASKDPEGRHLNLSLGGGALLDVGIYPITIANLFLGSPTTMESDVSLHPSGADIAETITYLYPEAEAVLKAGFDEDLPRDAFLYGTTGYIQIPHFNGAERAIVFDRNHKIVKVIEHKHLVNGLEYEIFETVKCIKKKCTESSIMSHEATIEILSQMDQLRREWNLHYPPESEAI